ncbi:MAG: ribose 5-phosphate isomerase B [Anaerolineales bacterium]|nr:ribose 5-phosphate isomerase B [Anaerolineales bacterium]
MVDENRIREMVRKVVLRTIGGTQPSAPVLKKQLISEKEIRELSPDSVLEIPSDALITPLARQIAMERRISLVRSDASSNLASNPDPAGSPSVRSSAQKKVIALGADHGGVGMKDGLIDIVRKLDYEVIDCGTNSKDSVDYPDFALAVAQLVSQGRAWRGIVVDGAGIGSCMAANKVPGVRAAMCYDQATAVNSREHNDANVLTLGAGLIGQNLANQIVTTWLGTAFGGGRHARRVNKIVDIEKRFSREQR